MAIITNLTESKADTAPPSEDKVSRRTFLYTGVPVLEVPAGHAAAGVPRLRAAAQALVVAALALGGAGAVLTVVHAH